MAITHTATNIVWVAVATKSIAAAGNATSDAFAFDATCIEASLCLKCDNDGTPASGDTVTYYILYTNGDTDAAGGTDEYDTTNAAVPVAVLDTNSADPQQLTIPLPITAAKGLKLYAVNNSAGRAITISALLMEKRSA